MITSDGNLHVICDVRKYREFIARQERFIAKQDEHIALQQRYIDELKREIEQLRIADKKSNELIECLEKCLRLQKETY